MTMPVITGTRVVPVAGRESILLNPGGVHGPYFTWNLGLLTDASGGTGEGTAPGGEDTRRTPEDAAR
ncbi:hypothetical protein [Actinomadura coerulea]|uniref:hypothetical protein n=1 Tax=Actinomadura coerulea TaxID=46159 RepID=UPI00341C4D97